MFLPKPELLLGILIKPVLWRLHIPKELPTCLGFSTLKAAARLNYLDEVCCQVRLQQWVIIVSAFQSGLLYLRAPSNREWLLLIKGHTSYLNRKIICTKARPADVLNAFPLK